MPSWSSTFQHGDGSGSIPTPEGVFQATSTNTHPPMKLAFSEISSQNLSFLRVSFQKVEVFQNTDHTEQDQQHRPDHSAQLSRPLNSCAMDSLTSLEVDEELRDLGHEAAWFLSSAKPGNGTWDLRREGDDPTW